MSEYNLIDHLVESGNLTEVNRASILKEMRRSRRSALELMTEWGFFSEEELIDLLSKIYDFQKADIDAVDFSNEKWTGYIDFFVANDLLPVSEDEDAIQFAVFNPMDQMLIRSLKKWFEKSPKLLLATKKSIVSFWEGYFDDDEEQEDEEQDISHIMDLASEGPVVRIVNDIITRAVELSASDIHLEAKVQDLKLRYRIDGILHDFPSPPSGMGPAVISRIKILSNLDIAERRIPQDGALKFPTSMKEVDIRVSVMPTVSGESIVMRILDKGKVILDFDHLGIPVNIRDTLIKLLQKSFGMIVVAGPTGAGKTTTLYTALKKIMADNRKVVTIEDPVEYKINEITQIQVNPKAGLTFAAGLRSVLRHDPDVVLVGEIRDAETASISIQAALTGHLVLSTLHANHASQVFSRFIDMGIEPFLVSSALIGTLSQRLVRSLCPNCKEKYQPDQQLLSRTGADIEQAFRSRGCEKCNRTGFKGRQGIYEILPIDETIQQHILMARPAAEIEAEAVKNGFRPMISDGIDKCQQGLTSLEEIFRVAG